jgi:hypothetical protein
VIGILGWNAWAIQRDAKLFRAYDYQRAKVWEIVFDDGRIEIVKSLQTWAIDNGYKPTSIRNLYNGSGTKKHKDIVSVKQLLQ